MAKIIRSITSVLLGSYPLGTDGTVQPIEWEVLKQEGNKALLCSKNILTTRRFDGKSNVWKNSEIRRWLKNNFMNTAFTEEEKAAILKTKLSDVGTTDKVFLLSSEEALTLYKSNDARRKTGSNSQWWLRSPHCGDGTVTGFIDRTGVAHDENLLIGGVSPALWVDLDSDIFKS